jgi:hypothetical protein
LKGIAFKPPQLLPLLALLAAGLLLWVGAYQVPFAQTLPIGGDLELKRRQDEAPFLTGINGSEPPDQVRDPDLAACQDDPPPHGLRCRIWWWELAERTGQRPYRWTTAETTLLVPGVGTGRYLIELSAGGAPGGSPVTLVSAGGPRYELNIPQGDPRRYRILAVTNAAGDLQLSMRTTPFVAPNDPRELGFVLYELRTRSAESAPRSPAWPQLGWLSLTVAALYLGALAAGAGVWGASLLAALAVGAAAWSLLFQRPTLTLFTPLLATLSVSGATVTMAAAVAMRRRRRLRGLAPVVGLVMSAWALRVAGMLHPHAIFSDSAMQANKLFAASLGDVFLTAGLPGAAGGGLAPYPPALFLILMPLQLFAPVEHGARIVLVQAGSAMLDSLVAALIWFVLRRCGLGSRAALFGAAAYLLPTAALESFSIGELANLGGQALAMPFLAMLAIGLASPLFGRSYWPLALLSAALSLALVAHSGVTLSLGALVATVWTLGVAGVVLGHPGPLSLKRLSLVIAFGLSFALLFYYSAPIYLERVLGGERSDPGGRSLPVILRETTLGILGFIPPGPRSRPIPSLLSLSAIAGLALLWAGRSLRPGTASLRLVLAAWWAATLITQSLLLVANQGVRWGLFLYPALCLSAGPLLAALWRRGRAGRLVAALTLTAIISFGLGQWVVQLRDYIHV